MHDKIPMKIYVTDDDYNTPMLNWFREHGYCVYWLNDDDEMMPYPPIVNRIGMVITTLKVTEISRTSHLGLKKLYELYDVKEIPYEEIKTPFETYKNTNFKFRIYGKNYSEEYSLRTYSSEHAKEIIEKIIETRREKYYIELSYEEIKI